MVYDPMGLKDTKSINADEEIKKCCSDCKTTKTPLWRGGPAGPKSLCNACGIRYRKNRRAILGSEKKKERIPASGGGGDDGGKVENSGSENEELKTKLKIVFQRSSMVKKERPQRRKKLLLGEEEQAAFSLMAMSSGSVFVFA
ncbi:GATA transcription factor 16-like [Euphorbia lathyris]|uniref:GATA transcription factor 16-like n=1 Tax=Euphorbia lathyris TaxID=212925 RepID=UPI0033138A7E